MTSQSAHSAGTPTIPVSPTPGVVGALTENDRRVMRQRHFGWEGASAGLLARVFKVSVQQVTAILKSNGPACANCGALICPCTDDKGRGPSDLGANCFHKGGF